MSEAMPANRPYACGAKTRAGHPCGQPGIPPSGRCRLHGGKSLRGLAHPGTKTGRWSKDLPTRLAARYGEALRDPDLLGLRDEVAILDVRLGELLARVNTSDGEAPWTRLQQLRAGYVGGEHDGDSTAAAMADVIEQGAEEWAAWREIGLTIEQRRKVVESERKRLVEMQQMMTTEQAMILLAVVVDTIRKYVTDRNALGAISRDLSRLLARGTGEAT